MRNVAIIALCSYASLCWGAAPTQTVYKCTEQGKTVYTDAPCMNGKQIDASPTRGMDKSTGVERKGADAMRDD